MLIARICDKGVLPPLMTYNLQMMRLKLREEDPNINIVLRSGIIMGDDKGKQPEDSVWVRKAPAKEAEFDLEHTHETFMEAKKSFTRPPLEEARIGLSRRWTLLCSQLS